ncbi:class I SAM-dependent methyltransferase [Paenibacillus macerans]|uniref:tRNA (adenine(22)-N(1))-methyltransferase n=1 Tax=Paenibacillus macerans TaxID=44252 RepID=UPI00203DD3A8|nr:class I SAM-dependent methyltransferase [Paenibacillus macerans]MCM3698533.1 class I SAM-dependent methyltransferase [Paenibacillus macerans]
MKLSARLQLISGLLPKGCRFADIGSDHALLPVSAVQSGRAAFAVAGEVNDGPLEAAKRQVAEAGETKRISVRKGDGLAVIAPGEVDAITIAGMGGALIVSILDGGKLKLAGVKRLVLQPNVGEEFVRRWLAENDWFLAEEAILEEDGKIYEVMMAEAASDAAARNAQLYADRKLTDLEGRGITLSKDLLFLMGPRLTREPDDVFFKKWESEIRKLEKIRRSVSASALEASREKEEELGRLTEQLKEVLTCLQKAKR